MGVDSNLLREMLMTPQIFLLVGLTVAVFTDTYLSRKHKMLMQVIFILAMSLVVQNVVEDWLACEHPNIQMRTGFAMYGYIVRPLFLLRSRRIRRLSLLRQHVPQLCRPFVPSSWRRIPA